MAGKSDYFGRMRRPTMLQLSYMEELMRMRGEQRKRGRVRAVAEKCGVNHAAVSRFFKSCIEAGYLHEDYSLTEDGMEWLDHYIGMRGALTEHFEQMKLLEEDIQNNVRLIMENTDDHIIIAMLDRMDQSSGRTALFKEQVGREYIPLWEKLQNGEHKVSFRVIKNSRGSSEARELSMGDRGFEKPATLVSQDDGAWLKLKVREMHARSAMSGEELAGHLTCLRYEMAGHLIKADVSDGNVTIPLDQCVYTQNAGGDITVIIPISISVSVGTTHMPESTAQLVIWL